MGGAALQRCILILDLMAALAAVANPFHGWSSASALRFDS
jgi:hypothetical protein